MDKLKWLTKSYLIVTVSAVRTPLSLLVGNLTVLRLRSNNLLQSDESLAERTPTRELPQAVWKRTIVLQSYSNLRIMLDLESVVQLLSTHIPARSFSQLPCSNCCFTLRSIIQQYLGVDHVVQIKYSKDWMINCSSIS